MTDYRDKPGYAFRPGPPPEASAFLKNKGLMPAFSWQDVEPEEHAVAFSVAKAMQVDVLESIRNAVQKALDDGVPFAQFQKELKPQLQKLGWWGEGQVVDPVTGKIRKAQLGSPRRLHTIYRANLRSARAAGQWERIQRTKRAMPYLLYQLGPSERHRPHHASKVDLVLPVDDPFWATWYPPNGWGCKCWVRQIMKREAEERGISDSPAVPMREVINTRTGEVKTIPSGIDPGWEINPGAWRAKRMGEFLAGKLETADPVVARTVARDIARSWRVQRIHEGSAKGAVPIAMLPERLAKALGSKTRVVQYSDYTAEKGRRKHPETTLERMADIADVLETGTVYQRQSQDAFSFVWEQDGRPWIAAIKVTRDKKELFLSTLYSPSQRYLARHFHEGTIFKGGK